MPLLRNTVSELLRGNLSIETACATARDAIAGSPESVAGIRTRVLRSAGEVQRDVADLAAYIAEVSPAAPGKWAATLLMLHVQLALGALPSAVRLATSVVQVSRGTCVPSAARFAVAIADSVLAFPGELTFAEGELLRLGRYRFSRIAAGQDPDL
ncbi:MAG: hypothetical protein ACJ8GN_17920 [Longimicrobiaceae bacterium]